jgi:putative endonuclease
MESKLFLFLIMPLPYCVYILFSKKDFLLYIGFTTNINARVKNHNSGGTKSTANRIPLDLIFCEFYLFEEDARKRESYFKTTMGKKAIKLMLRTTLEKMGYKGSLKTLTIIPDPETDEQ